MTAPKLELVSDEMTSRVEAARRDYQIALARVRYHHHIDIGYSLVKLEQHAQALGRDDVVAIMRRTLFEMCGAPKIRAFATGLGFDLPNGLWFRHMSTGIPCSQTCTRGCLGKAVT